MKLQLALDTCNTEEALNIVQEVYDFVDIVEIGTPLIIRYGMEPVRTIKIAYPEKTILADVKIMDAGEYEAKIAFESGADIVTVMGVTHDNTIEGAVKAAKEFGGEIVADMMAVQNLEERAKQLLKLGVHYVCIHVGVDAQSTESPFESLEKIQKAIGSQFCAIAGGINQNSVERVLDYQPGIVIVGNGITGQTNRHESASVIFKLLNENK
ncbi:3-hexulose-6-phosphate synthase [Planomicrobium sp. CPCC 101110]|uniref:3-hexulose-6-phosphate synthase n=1 Tax=Planomicrobium sp. CPCC 101110 TaxID=2599619 RepID=UPI0011B64626|nr:3-hexulose-6-phosphate synthase [Planomicrobium sp. CPCC 101110]TWT25414.1 3-hexulose-6-phosphate synthase [Planomicrobium sp. CPCC 101110]